MDPSQLPPLRSGLGVPGQIQSPLLQGGDSQKTMISAIAVMTQKSAYLALKYAVHDSRQQATVEDVNMAIRYQARHFIHTIDRPDVMEEIAAMKRAIFGSDSGDSGPPSLESVSDESEDDSSSTASSTGSSADLLDPPVDEDYAATRELDAHGVCQCQECTEVRAANDSWDTWEPDDPVELYLRDSVNKATAEAEQMMQHEDDF